MAAASELIRPVFAGAALLGALMAILWLVHLAIRNAAIVDVGWAAGLPVLAAWYAWRLDGGGRGRLLAALVTIWGVRLASHLLRARVIGHAEEGRYVQLRQQWKAHLAWKFLLFFEAQAVLNVVLSVPFLIACATGGAPGVVEWTASALWLVAMLGEATADRQLDVFKRDSANRGRVCRVGLWRYSRHPNYFFEWLIWVAYALFASGSPFGWLGWVSPAIILYLLFKVTGIPATEAQAVRTRGDAYRDYQATTSAFVPWFPRGRRT